MDTVSSIVAKVNSFLWDYLLIILLCGSGIYFTIRFKFVQIFKFKDGWDRTFGSISLMGKSAGKEGMSSFQSLATAIAAQVGTGNLAGAATALISGGPGAIFWMWRSWCYILDVGICLFRNGYYICRGIFGTKI